MAVLTTHPPQKMTSKINKNFMEPISYNGTLHCCISIKIITVEKHTQSNEARLAGY